MIGCFVFQLVHMFVVHSGPNAAALAKLRVSMTTERKKTPHRVYLLHESRFLELVSKIMLNVKNRDTLMQYTGRLVIWLFVLKYP